jgi:hypothetical protein
MLQPGAAAAEGLHELALGQPQHDTSGAEKGLFPVHKGRDAVLRGCPLQSDRRRRLKDRPGREAADNGNSRTADRLGTVKAGYRT